MAKHIEMLTFCDAQQQINRTTEIGVRGMIFYLCENRGRILSLKIIE